MRVRELFR